MRNSPCAVSTFSIPLNSETTQISTESLGLTAAVNEKISSNTMGEDPYVLLYSPQDPFSHCEHSSHCERHIRDTVIFSKNHRFIQAYSPILRVAID